MSQGASPAGTHQAAAQCGRRAGRTAPRGARRRRPYTGCSTSSERQEASDIGRPSDDDPAADLTGGSARTASADVAAGDDVRSAISTRTCPRGVGGASSRETASARASRATERAARLPSPRAGGEIFPSKSGASSSILEEPSPWAARESTTTALDAVREALSEAEARANLFDGARRPARRETSRRFRASERWTSTPPAEEEAWVGRRRRDQPTQKPPQQQPQPEREPIASPRRAPVASRLGRRRLLREMSLVRHRPGAHPGDEALLRMRRTAVMESFVVAGDSFVVVRDAAVLPRSLAAAQTPDCKAVHIAADETRKRTHAGRSKRSCAPRGAAMLAAP